jgi:hypothetical protein
MVHCQKTQWFNLIPIEILYKPEIVVERKCLCGLHQKIKSKNRVQGKMIEDTYEVRVEGRKIKKEYLNDKILENFLFMESG